MKMREQKIRCILIVFLSVAVVFSVYGENETSTNVQPTPKSAGQQPKVVVTTSGTMGAPATTPAIGGGMGMGGGMMMGGYGGGMAIPAPAEPSSVLIIPKGEQDIQAINEIMEDGKIMSQIISEAIPPAQGQSPFKGYIGNALYGVFGSAGQISCLYIEQYGMIFVRPIDYPLLPSEKVESRPQQDKDTDKVWKKAKRTVQGQAVLEDNPDNAPPSYDQARVEQLKQNLFAALKHASNIRRLEAAEYIVIALRYSPPPGRDTYHKRPDLPDISQESQPTGPQSSSMIIRAAKRDIDLFADEEIDNTEFKKRAEVILY